MRSIPFALCIIALFGAGLFITATAHAQGPGGSPASQINFYGSPNSGKPPLEVHFHLECDESTMNQVTKWSWDFGDGATSSDGYTSHTYEKEGTFTVSLAHTIGDKTYTTARKNYISVGANVAPQTESQPEQTPQDQPQPAQTSERATTPNLSPPSAADDLVFIHHSCGENWLNSGLHHTLAAKNYIDERNDITYGVAVAHDSGRPASLGDVAGELTDMHHWVLWFNDYLDGVRRHDCASGVNRIVVFKSCFPNSHVDDNGTEPGDPFSDWKTTANYKAVFRHPAGPGNTYEHDGNAYRALEDVFAKRSDTLFIAITAPPECWQDSDAEIGARARAFNLWLKGEWLAGYQQRTGLHNVAVFDWFDVLAAPASDRAHANRLRGEYGGGSGDSHPNDAANTRSTQLFAAFLDTAWQAFTAGK
ncbi:MAG: PKD domain-containing protein [Candidatus Hydrogenedentes bacterium]|nr:PKD domain-containing protein [Candidatus Hydrogenedentota bacterium]